jgi:thymidylate synthase
VRIEAATVDDVLRKAYEAILDSGSETTSTRGKNRELIAVQLLISDARARISRTEARATLQTALGELLWYLAKSDDIEFIKYYAPRYPEHVKVEEGHVVAAYGPRLFNFHGVDQVRQIIDLLKARPSSRQAVLQLFDCSDLAAETGEVPCTCTVQFLLRNEKLEAIATMRSNDAVRGLPHDVFAFTFLQEIISRSLGVDVGGYHHWVGSLHIYADDREVVGNFVSEGWQQTAGIAMPPMPFGDPWPQIERLLEAERAFRVDQCSDPWPESKFRYWDDLIWLLEMFRHIKLRDVARAVDSWNSRKTKAFDAFIWPRVERLKKRADK